MTFANIPTYEKKENTQAKRLEYLDLSSPAIVRILSRHPYSVDSHFFMSSKASVECLGDECPVCEVNRKVYANNPEDFRDDPNYHARSIRFFVNVLDRTPTRICAKCNAEVKNPSTPACPKCSEIISGIKPEPLNKVKVLGKGVQLFEQLNAIEASVLGQDGSPLGLTTYDLTLVPSGSGKKTTITPIPDKSSNDVVEVPEENLFDLTKAIVKLSREEMIDLQKGISLKDIFAARKATKEDVVKEPTVIDEDVAANARKTVDELFASLEA
jgi:hypothetical protein